MAPQAQVPEFQGSLSVWRGKPDGLVGTYCDLNVSTKSQVEI
jgi:hypothetical protein